MSDKAIQTAKDDAAEQVTAAKERAAQAQKAKRLVSEAWDRALPRDAKSAP